MNKQFHAENEGTLIVDSRVNLENYRTVWFETFKEDLPNTITFWGTLTIGSLVVAYLFKDSLLGVVVFLIVALVVFLIPLLMLLFSYQAFISAQKNYLSNLSESEKHFNLIFRSNSDGFECVAGKNFSFISWDSIKKVTEKKNYFLLDLKSQPFVLMKNDFKNTDEIDYFRLLLSNSLDRKVKLLNDSSK